MIVSSPGMERVVAEKRPADVPRPPNPTWPRMPLSFGLAGNRPAVTYWCGDELQPTTLVYDVSGGDTLQVTGAISSRPMRPTSSSAGGQQPTHTTGLLLGR